MREKPKCSECLYWERQIKSEKPTTNGVCCGKMPDLGPNGYGYWPMTKETEGCWAGQPKESQLLTEKKEFRPLDEQ